MPKKRKKGREPNNIFLNHPVFRVGESNITKGVSE